MSLEHVLTLLFIYVAVTLNDSLQSIETAAVAHGKIELAARTDAIKMGISLWGMGSVLSIVILDQLSIYSLLATIVYCGGGYTGNQIGMRLSLWLEQRTGKKQLHRFHNIYRAD